MASQYQQFGQIPFQYINGFQISNNALTPNTVLDIGAGSCLDSTVTFQLSTSSTVSINSAASGLNGLDTGTIAASTVYAVYLVADPVYANAPGFMLSLSTTAPLLPFGYSAFRLIGYVATNGSSQFLKGLWSAGNSSTRTFAYDAPQATSITAGNAVVYTNVALTTLVPSVDGVIVNVASALTPSAASQTLKLTPFGGVGDAVTITGQVASVVVSSNSRLFSKLNAGVPTIRYVVSAAGAAAALNVAGYEYSV